MSNHDHEGRQSPGQDAALKRAWQQASDEQPPPELDAAIIAAARKSVQDHGASVTPIRSGPRRRNWWMKWQPLAAAATVAGLALVLVQLMPRERDVAPSIRIERPAPGPATADENPPGPSAREANESTEEKAATPATVAPSREPAAAPNDERTEMAVPTLGTAVPAPSVPKAAAAAAAPARDTSQGNAAPSSAADWAARITALYASGDAEGAAEALRAFRASDPDADTYLPASLGEWARTVE